MLSGVASKLQVCPWISYMTSLCLTLLVDGNHNTGYIMELRGLTAVIYVIDLADRIFHGHCQITLCGGSTRLSSYCLAATLFLSLCGEERWVGILVILQYIHPSCDTASGPVLASLPFLAPSAFLASCFSLCTSAAVSNPCFSAL
jgi:hypothetical protein